MFSNEKSIYSLLRGNVLCRPIRIIVAPRTNGLLVINGGKSEVMVFNKTTLKLSGRIPCTSLSHFINDPTQKAVYIFDRKGGKMGCYDGGGWVSLALGENVVSTSDICGNKIYISGGRTSPHKIFVVDAERKMVTKDISPRVLIKSFYPIPFRLGGGDKFVYGVATGDAATFVVVEVATDELRILSRVDRTPSLSCADVFYIPVSRGDGHSTIWGVDISRNLIAPTLFLPFNFSPYDIRYSPGKIYLPDRTTNEVKVFDTTEGRLIGSIRTRGVPVKLSLREGGRLYILDSSQSVLQIDTLTGEVTEVFDARTNYALDFSVDPETRNIFIVGREGFINLIDGHNKLAARINPNGAIDWF